MNFKSHTIQFVVAILSAYTCVIVLAASSDLSDPGVVVTDLNVTTAELRISGKDADGNFLPLSATITDSNGELISVSGDKRYVVPPGKYSLFAGVPTLNGSVYKPVSREIVIEDAGDTNISLTLARPPVIVTRFKQGETSVPGVIVDVYQNGERVFGVRPDEEHFILPGTYVFRANLDSDNELAIEQTVKENGYRVIDFLSVETVHAIVSVYPSGSEIILRQHQEFLVNNEIKYNVHWRNGADILPGIYSVRSDHPLTPYTIDEVEILSGNNTQRTSFHIPFAIVQASYIFQGEASTLDLRCWFVRIDGEGKEIATSESMQCGGEPIYLAEGYYRIKPWDALGNFKEVYFHAVTGATETVSIIEEQ